MTATKRRGDTEHGLDGVSPATHPARDATHIRRIVRARKGVEAGDSWTIIGAALESSRQNAFQRLGR